MIQRRWIKQKELAQGSTNDFIDIWDGGWCRYERLPDGSEKCWEILDRQITEDGFTETLRQLPAWKDPGLVLHQERVPLYCSQQHANQEILEVPGWRILSENILFLCEDISQETFSSDRIDVGENEYQLPQQARVLIQQRERETGQHVQHRRGENRRTAPGMPRAHQARQAHQAPQAHQVRQEHSHSRRGYTNREPYNKNIARNGQDRPEVQPAEKPLSENLPKPAPRPLPRLVGPAERAQMAQMNAT